MQPFVIPSIFTAVDKYSGVMSNMGYATQNLNSRIEMLNSKSERLFNKLTPSLSQASSQFLSFASSAAIAAAIVGTAKFSVDSLMKYEDEMANLKAITGATDEQFGVFEKNINSVAKETKKSSVEVAQAFTAIANNQPELLKDAAALAEVTKQSILLSKAAKIELQPAGEAITQILNQYGKGADYAAKTVSTLAAGSVAGSSEIRDTAEAIKQFGTVAAVAGVKIDESVALIELGSKFDKGAEAGVKFRNILLGMTGAKVLDKLALKDLHKAGVNLDVVSNKALPLNTRLLEMSKIAKDTNAIMHVFGKENAAMAAGVLNNANAFAGMLTAVSTTGVAEDMAAKNANTLRTKIDEAKNSFINMLTSSDNLGSGLEAAKTIIGYVATNMNSIVTVGMNVLKFFALWKASILLTKAYMVGYNVVFGINNALQKRSLFYVEANTIAKNADLVTTKAVTAATWLFNAALSANPIMLAVLAIAALTAGLILLTNQQEKLRAEYIAQQNLKAEESKKAELVAIDKLTQSYKNLGYSIKDATIKSLEFERQSIKLEQISLTQKIANNKQAIKETTLGQGGAIFGEFTEKHSKAKEDLVANEQRNRQLSERNLALTQYAVAAANSGLLDKNAVSGILNKTVYSNGSGNVLSPEQLNAKQLEANRIKQITNLEQGYRPPINNKMSSAQAVASTITSTNNAEVKITIKNEGTTPANVDTGTRNSSVLPKTTSTLSMGK